MTSIDTLGALCQIKNTRYAREFDELRSRVQRVERQLGSEPSRRERHHATILMTWKCRMNPEDSCR